MRVKQGSSRSGAVHGAFQNDANPTYRNFVQRCLRERGYDVIGWQ